MVISIGIGEYACSNCPNDILETHALGSCVALIVFCRHKRVLAMSHIALPESRLNLEKAKEQPGYFADTAVSAMLDLLERGAGCARDGLIPILCGGANSARGSDVFKIGERNVIAARQALSRFGLYCARSETGGNWSRTVRAEVATGTVEIYSRPFAY